MSVCSRHPAFPPVNSGGLIEARSKPVTSDFIRHGARFPPVNSGGLIEAADVQRDVSRANPAMFPPVNSGGLIEAAVDRRASSVAGGGVSAGEFRRPH